MKLTKFFKNVYSEGKFLAANTNRLYGHTIRAYGRYLGSTARVRDLNTKTIVAFVTYLVDEGRLASSTIEKHCAILKALSEVAARQNNPKTGQRYIPEYPSIPQIKTQKKIPVAYSIEEIFKLFEAIGEIKGSYENGIPKSMFWDALHRVGLDTAERKTALLSARHDDINGNVITFRPETRKNKTEANIKTLRPSTIKAIQSIRIQDSDLIFPYDKSETTLYRELKQIQIAAGVYKGKGHKFHSLRKTHSTLVHINGGDACESLGHSSPALTKRCYIDPTKTNAIDFTGHFKLPELRVAA